MNRLTLKDYLAVIIFHSSTPQGLRYGVELGLDLTTIPIGIVKDLSHDIHAIYKVYKLQKQTLYCVCDMPI